MLIHINKLFLDFGGTDFKYLAISGNKVSKLQRRDIRELLGSENSFKIYPASKIKDIVLDTVLGLVDQKTPTVLYISSQMSTAYEVTTLRQTDALISWQSKPSPAIPWESYRLERDLSGNDLKIGSPTLTVPSYLKEHGIRFEGGNRLRLDTAGGFIADSVLGYKSHVRHSTDAFSLGAYVANSDFEIIDSFRNIEFPKVSSRMMSLGESEVFQNCHVMTPVGDQQSSLFGIDLLEAEIAVNIGTGGQVAQVNIRTDPIYSRTCQQRPYFDGNWISTVTHLPAGRVVSHYFKVWNKVYKSNFSNFLALSSTKSTSRRHIKNLNLSLDYDSVVDLDVVDFNPKLFDYPESLPIRLAEALAEVYVEAIYNLPEISNAVQLVFAGGLGSKFLGLQEKLSERLGLPVRVSSSEETTIQGLIKLSRQVPLHGQSYI